MCKTITKVNTVVFVGIQAKVIEIQVHLASGLPSFNIVGLANKSVVESKERIRAAFSFLGLNLPPKRITVNLSPSDLNKEGNHFDLPIALSLLAAFKVIPQNNLGNFIALGELSLNGDILPVKGVLAALVTCVKQNKGLILPEHHLNEVSLFAEKVKLLPINNIEQAIDHFNNRKVITAVKTPPKEQPKDEDYIDLAEIKGQKMAVRALEIAAAGEHNLIFIGPPGVGKSTIAHAIKGIIPPLTKKEMLSTSIVYSLAGLLEEHNLITNRPFRAPHHTASEAAIIGGGNKTQPGEISLATNGILFLDELAEFKSSTLDSLRQPLESGKIFISRANEKVCFPCNFQLIAATNPCKCGYFTVPNKECSKAPNCAINYQSKISGPFLDRIDLIVELSLPEEESYELKSKGEKSSSDIFKKVVAARAIQSRRYRYLETKTNAKMDNYFLQKTIANIQNCPKAWELLEKFVKKFKISLRAYNKVIKLSRTISDLENCEQINEFHISEALSYRKTDCATEYTKR